LVRGNEATDGSFPQSNRPAILARDQRNPDRPCRRAATRAETSLVLFAGWIALVFHLSTTVITYEVIKICQALEKSALEAFFGLRKW